MEEELKGIYYQATEHALLSRAIGEEEEVRRYEAIMACTSRYKNDDYIRGLQMGSLQQMLSGGDNDVYRLTAPGD
jgi:hypothetical protein